MFLFFGSAASIVLNFVFMAGSMEFRVVRSFLSVKPVRDHVWQPYVMAGRIQLLKIWDLYEIGKLFFRINLKSPEFVIAYRYPSIYFFFILIFKEYRLFQINDAIDCLSCLVFDFNPPVLPRVCEDFSFGHADFHSR